MDEQARWRVSPASALAELAPPFAPNPWRSIWFSPRLTVRQLIEADGRPSWVPVFFLACLAGVLNVLNEQWANGQLHVPILAGTLATLVAVGLAGQFAGAWFLGVYGRWRGGVGTAQQLRIAYGWSGAPGAICFLIWPLVWIANGGPVRGFPSMQTGGQILAGVLYALTIITPWWSLVLGIAAVASVHRFSVWRAIECVVCVMFAVMTAFVIFALGIAGMRAVV